MIADWPALGAAIGGIGVEAPVMHHGSLRREIYGRSGAPQRVEAEPISSVSRNAKGINRRSVKPGRRSLLFALRAVLNPEAEALEGYPRIIQANGMDELGGRSGEAGPPLVGSGGRALCEPAGLPRLPGAIPRRRDGARPPVLMKHVTQWRQWAG